MARRKKKDAEIEANESETDVETNDSPDAEIEAKPATAPAQPVHSDCEFLVELTKAAPLGNGDRQPQPLGALTIVMDGISIDEVIEGIRKGRIELKSDSLVAAGSQEVLATIEPAGEVEDAAPVEAREVLNAICNQTIARVRAKVLG